MTRSVTLVVPAALRDLNGGRSSVDLGAEIETVAEALDRLYELAPAVYHRVMTEVGEVRTHVNVFVGRDDIRWIRGLETPVPAGGELYILPAVSGG
jgi:molybdopterin synthase sulfur carrier subunit